MHTQLMCCFMNMQPTIRAYFIGADLFPDLRMKDLCSSARKRIQAGFMHQLQPFLCSNSCFAEHVVQFNRGKTFDMEIRTDRFYLFHQFAEELKIHFWMYAAYNMHFCYRLTIIFFYDVQHLWNTQFPSLFTMGIQPGITAKVTGKHANVGWLNVEIAVKISCVPMQPLPYVICQ